MSTQYADDGYAYYSVITPTVCLEYRLPNDPHRYTREDRKKWAVLEHAADIHDAPIIPSGYALG